MAQREARSLSFYVCVLVMLVAMVFPVDGQKPVDFMRPGTINKTYQERGMGHLHIAAAEGDSAEVARLIESGAGLEEQDGVRWTPLFHAVEKAHLDVIKILFEKGADPNAKTGIEATPLMLNAFFTDEEHTKVLELFLANPKTKVDAVQSHGWTALTHAVKFDDNYNQTRMLLNAGAGPNAQDIYGMTPFMTAVERMQIGCIHMFLNRSDLDYSISDIYGADVYMFAAHADPSNQTGLIGALKHVENVIEEEKKEAAVKTELRI